MIAAADLDCRLVLARLLQAERRHRDEARQSRRQRESLVRSARLARRRTDQDRKQSPLLRRLHQTSAEAAARYELAAEHVACWLEERSGVDRQDFLKLLTESAFPPDDAGAAARALDDLTRDGRTSDLLAFIWKNHPQAATELGLPMPSAIPDRPAAGLLPLIPSSHPPSLGHSVPPSSSPASSRAPDLLTTDELARLAGVTKRRFRNALAELRKHPDAALRPPEPAVAHYGTQSAAYHYTAIRPILLHKWPARAMFLPESYAELRHWLNGRQSS